MLVRPDQGRRPRVYPWQVSWTDVTVASLVVLAGLRGWNQGLLRQLGTIIGRLAGVVGGCYLALALAPRFTVVAWRPLDVVVVIATTTLVGGLIFRYLGGRLSARLHEERLGFVDSGGGALLGATGMLVTCWFVAVLVAALPGNVVGASINHSVILRTVQRILPTPPALASRVQTLLNQTNVPRLFADVVVPTLTTAPIGRLATQHHQLAPAAVVAVAVAGGCGVDAVGSGFVVAPGEVLTSAHLVAGRRHISVNALTARIVAFDPRADVAVLRVSTSVAPLSLSDSAVARRVGELVGFAAPGDRVRASAVVLGSVRGPGRDIYSGPLFSRQLAVVVAPASDSETGAPILVNGRVVAMVIERAVAGTDFWYADGSTQLRAELWRVTGAAISTRCVS
jgi:uncharacterized membrane protein required for colicin V production